MKSPFGAVVQEELAYATIRYHPDTRIIELVWNDFVSGQEFRQTVNRCLQLATECEAAYWLANDARLRPIRAADREWMLKVFLPRLAHHGFRRFAGISSADPIAQMAVEEFVTTLRQAVTPVPVRIFLDRPAAWSWLTEGMPVMPACN